MSIPPKSVAVPALDLKAQYQGIRDEIEPVIKRVLENQMFIQGPEVEAAGERAGRILRRRARDRLCFGDRCAAPAPDGLGYRCR